MASAGFHRAADWTDRTDSTRKALYKRAPTPASAKIPILPMSTSEPGPLTDDEHAQMRRWLETWRRAGPILELERIDRMRALTELDAARIACDLWRLARPGGGDDAEGLLPLKVALRNAGRNR
jgi:hypothetical protein